jgi:ABC-type lipopolysaccharide export system ATPase subunit
MSKFKAGDTVEWCERSKEIMEGFIKDPELAVAKGKVVSIFGDNGIGETLYNVDWTTGQSKVIAENHLVAAA